MPSLSQAMVEVDRLKLRAAPLPSSVWIDLELQNLGVLRSSIEYSFDGAIQSPNQFVSTHCGALAFAAFAARAA